MAVKTVANCAVILGLLIVALPTLAGQPLDGPERPLFKSIARKIAEVSSYQLKGTLRVLYYDFKGPNEDLDGRSVEGIPAFLGQSPVSAYGPREAENSSDLPAVTVTGYIFYYARDHDEAAFMIAHEMAHLELGHPEAYTQVFCRAYRAVVGQQAPCTGTRAEVDRLKQLAPIESSRIDAMTRANEITADAGALELMVRAGYDPRAAERLLQSMDELHRKYDFKPSATHPQPLDRLRLLQRRIDQLAARR